LASGQGLVQLVLLQALRELRELRVQPQQGQCRAAAV